MICENVEYDAICCLCHSISCIMSLAFTHFLIQYTVGTSITDDADEMARLDSNRFHEVVGVLDELHNDGNFSTFFRHASNYVQREYPCDATPSWTSCRIVDVSCLLDLIIVICVPSNNGKVGDRGLSLTYVD